MSSEPWTKEDFIRRLYLFALLGIGDRDLTKRKVDDNRLVAITRALWLVRDTLKGRRLDVDLTGGYDVERRVLWLRQDLVISASHKTDQALFESDFQATYTGKTFSKTTLSWAQRAVNVGIGNVHTPRHWKSASVAHGQRWCSEHGHNMLLTKEDFAANCVFFFTSDSAVLEKRKRRFIWIGATDDMVLLHNLADEKLSEAAARHALLPDDPFSKGVTVPSRSGVDHQQPGNPELVSRLLQEWWSGEMNDLRRYFMREFLPQSRARLVGHRFKEVDTMIPDDNGRATRFCFFFDRVGWHCKQAEVSPVAVLAPMFQTMRKTWLTIEPLVAEERFPAPGRRYDAFYFRSFEWLFNWSSDPEHERAVVRAILHEAGKEPSPSDVDRVLDGIHADEEQFKHELTTLLNNR